MIKITLLIVTAGISLLSQGLMAMTIADFQQDWSIQFKKAKDALKEAKKVAKPAQEGPTEKTEGKKTKPDSELFPKNVFEFFRALHEIEIVEDALSEKGSLTPLEYLVKRKLPHLIKRDRDWERYATDEQKAKQKTKRHAMTDAFAARLGEVMANADAAKKWLEEVIVEQQELAEKKAQAARDIKPTAFLSKFLGTEGSLEVKKAALMAQLELDKETAPKA